MNQLSDYPSALINFSETPQWAALRNYMESALARAMDELLASDTNEKILINHARAAAIKAFYRQVAGYVQSGGLNGL